MFETGIPVLKPTDPEYVHVNAAFCALSHAPSRRILELLVVQPATPEDIVSHVGGNQELGQRLLEELRVVGFVTMERIAGRPMYRYGGPAVDRVKSWMTVLR